MGLPEILSLTWWRHQMETFSALQAIFAGNSPHKGQWRGTLMFSVICVWINGWINNGEAVDLRRPRAHYDVTVMNWRICRFCVIPVATLVLFCFRKPQTINIVVRIPMLLRHHPVVTSSELHFTKLHLGLIASQNNATRHSIKVGGTTLGIIIPSAGINMLFLSKYQKLVSIWLDVSEIINTFANYLCCVYHNQSIFFI